MRKLGNNDQKRGAFDRYPLTSMVSVKKSFIFILVSSVANLTWFAWVFILKRASIWGSVRAHIDFGSYSKTHTDSCARTQLPPPRGLALINELKVQRCSAVIAAGHFAAVSLQQRKDLSREALVFPLVFAL